MVHRGLSCRSPKLWVTLFGLSSLVIMLLFSTSVSTPHWPATPGAMQPLKLLIVHKRLPDLSTGCDRRLLALVNAFRRADADVDVTYLSMPVSMDGLALTETVEGCIASGSKEMFRAEVPPFSMVEDTVIQEPKDVSAAWLSDIEERGRAVQWREITTRKAFGVRHRHFCQRLAILVHSVGVDDFDAVLFPVWFWPFGGVGGSQHHSLAHQVLPALRSHVGDLGGDGEGSSWPQLISISDDAFSARQRLLARTESGAAEQGRMLEAAALLTTKEATVYDAVDLAAFISAEDRDLSFHAGRRQRLSDPSLILLRPSAQIVLSSDNAVGFTDRRGLVFLGSGAVETNYQGIQWFLKRCWPTIRTRLPEVTLTIVGKPPGRFSVCRKRGAHCSWEEGSPYDSSNATSGVVTTGFLEVEDLTRVLQGARLFIEPIVSSTGINTKAFTGFEHDIPVLMTHPAASGLNLDDNPVPNTVMPDAAAFTEAVLQLHEDKSKWAAALQSQRAYVAALNSADRGRHDAVALVRHIDTLKRARSP